MRIHFSHKGATSASSSSKVWPVGLSFVDGEGSLSISCVAALPLVASPSRLVDIAVRLVGSVPASLQAFFGADITVWCDHSISESSSAESIFMTVLPNLMVRVSKSTRTLCLLQNKLPRIVSYLSRLRTSR